MKKAVPLFALMTLAAAGCASVPAGQSSLPTGKFVTMKCSDNKVFQVRMSDDASTVRVRAHPGAAELERQADGRYVGDDFVLNLRAEGGAALDHGGKSQGKGCTPVA